MTANLDTQRFTIHKAITIHAPAASVWAALTDPHLFQKWLADDHVTVVSEWQTGQPILFTGNWHGAKIKDKGIILQLEPEQTLRYSYWSKISRLPDLPENYSIIEFRLAKLDAQTMLTLTHSNIKLDVAYKHWNFYWAMAMDRIRKLVEKIS